MRLQSLKLCNFRPYYGDVELHFPDEVEGELFLIHGHNGYGKTSLYTAVQWALYGEDGRRELYDNANSRARDRDESFTMSVALEFTHDGQEYSLLREAKASRNPVEKPDHLSRSVLTLYRDGVPLSGEQEVAQERVTHIIPKDASQFFFFDGEQIGRYSSAAHTDETRAAIELVLGLKAVQNARDDATSLRAEIRRERNRALERSDRHADIVNRQVELEAAVEQMATAAAEAEARVRDNEVKRAEYRTQLEELSEVQGLAEREKELETEAQRVRDERNEVIALLQKESRGLYLRVLAPSLLRVHEECEARYEQLREREMSRRLGESVTKYLIDLQGGSDCVCGRPIDSAEREAIESVVRSLAGDTLTTDPEAPAADEVPVVAARLDLLRKARSTAERAAHRFEELKIRKVDLDDRLSELESALAQVQSQMRSIDVESVNGLRELVDRLDDEISMGIREQAGFEQQITQKRDELSDLDKQLSRLGGASAAVQAMDAQIALLTRTEEAFDEYLIRSARARREQIEEQANVFFRQLTNKEFGYESMFIADDFTFGIRAADGTSPNMDQISAGEKHVVAFSFIMGLNQYARSTAPLMIDTPMGRLDRTHRVNLSKALAGLEQQVFLFVTDTDLGYGVEEVLRESLEREFDIIHDQATLSSRVAEREEAV